MKRISIIFLLMLTLVITAGCNNNSAPPADTTTSAPDTTTEAAPTGITLYENGMTQFRVVFPSKVADEEFDAYLKIADAFKKLGITIKNAKYPLTDGEITCDYQYGISNEVLKGTTAEVRLTQGRLLLIKVREG